MSSDSFLKFRRAVLELLRNPRRGDLVQLLNHARKERHATRPDRPVETSYAGEAEHTRQLLGRLGVRGGFVVDIAAADGVSQSSTLWMFRDPAWQGLAVEMDPAKFARLAYSYAPFPGARLARWKVTPGNVALLLRLFEVPPDFTFLNLDIDSYDLAVLEAMVDAGHRPRIVSLEVNEKIPPPVWFTVLPDETHAWKGDHFHGCSLQAAAASLGARGYLLDSMHYNNAFFVEQAFAAGRVAGLSPAEAYRAGYGDRADRLQLFPWNAEVECLQALPPDEAVRFLHALFEPYRGRYELRVEGGTGGGSRGGTGP